MDRARQRVHLPELRGERAQDRVARGHRRRFVNAVPPPLHARDAGRPLGMQRRTGARALQARRTKTFPHRRPVSDTAARCRGDRRMQSRLGLYRGKWAAIWLDEAGQTRRSSLSTADRRVAERNFATWLAANQGPRALVADIVPAYLADREGRASHQRAVDAWKRLEPHFGHLRPQDIGRTTCREYSMMRSRRVQAGTIIKELCVLRAALRWQDKLTPAVIEMPPAPPPRDRYLTREEYRALRDAAASMPHIQLFIIVAYCTAGRRGAVLELTWDRVDFDRGLVRLATQDEHGNKGRALVPMNDPLQIALERAQRAALTDYVIEYAGRPVASVKTGFKTAVERAGLERVTPHVLRHTAAVHMAEAGVPISEIAQYLGHTNSRITERVYARYSPGYLRRAASALE